MSDVRPVDNDCAGGFVYFTFDDGPFVNTPLILDRLHALNLKATFFVVGEQIAGREDVVRQEVMDGHSVQNHTYSHRNLVTGADSAGMKPAIWSGFHVTEELEEASRAIVLAGAPAPTQYRPPFGAVDPQVEAIAAQSGLTLVMPWSEGGNIIDSGDTEKGVTSGNIVNVVTTDLAAGKIITMHDGDYAASINSALALQAIVDEMNEKHLCSAPHVPVNATGGI